MEELIKELLAEQKKTNKLLEYNNLGKDPNELLTVEDVHKEYGIGINTVRKIFQDKKLAVQRYITPFKVTRQEADRYFNESHDYLSERK